MFSLEDCEEEEEGRAAEGGERGEGVVLTVVYSGKEEALLACDKLDGFIIQQRNIRAKVIDF